MHEQSLPAGDRDNAAAATVAGPVDQRAALVVQLGDGSYFKAWRADLLKPQQVLQGKEFDMALDFTADPAWHKVENWPGLSAEAKRAWQFLWGRVNGKASVIRVTESDIGAALGSGEAKRVGQRLLKQLVACGLVAIVTHYGPEYKLCVLDPAAVAQQPTGDGGGRPAA